LSGADGQAHKRNAVLALLSLGAGTTDVLTFLRLGNLFTSAMTGNAALLMVSIGNADWRAASRAVTALIGFAAGVAFASALASRWKALPEPGPLRRLLVLELVFLTACASLWSATAATPPGALLYAVIVLSAFSMGMQAICARSIDVPAISTIVFTSVLIRIVSRLTQRLASRDPPAAPAGELKPHFATFAAYACGALIAGLFAAAHHAPLAWLPVAAVAVALGML
jgi:uncharacterized membrane protein YoaK (UPF0700 family)